MDPYQYSGLEKLILDLLEPDTRPEKALQFFSSQCFSPDTYGEEDTEPVMIFFAYIRYIMIKLPDAHVVGIWEDILRKTFLYTKHFSGSQSQATLERRISSSNIHSRIVPKGGFKFRIWLDKALNTHSMCPNPLIRLELFRLIRILKIDFGFVPCGKIWTMFKYTICEIKPYHIYPSDKVDEPLFGIKDLEYIINIFCLKKGMRITISYDTMKELAKKNELFLNDKEIRFICHFIRLVGIFASMADTVSDSFFSVLKHTLARMVKFEQNYAVFCLTREQLQKLISLPPFHHNINETVRDLTEAILNNNRVDVKRAMFLMSQRDEIVMHLGVCTNMSDLPRLLLSRQVQSPMVVRQHSLLLENLDTRYNSEEDIAIEEDFDRYLQI